MRDNGYDKLKKVKYRPESGTVIASNKPSAPAMLHKAALIMEERGKVYDADDGERSMGKTIVAFNAITGRDLKESEGWLLLQLLKDVRQWSTPEYHQDSAEDCIAYSALKGEALEVEFTKQGIGEQK